MIYGDSSVGKSAASITQLYPDPLRTRPWQVTSPITARVIETAYHLGHIYEEVVIKLAVYGMWISREVYFQYKIAYHNDLKGSCVL